MESKVQMKRKLITILMILTFLFTIVVSCQSTEDVDYEQQDTNVEDESENTVELGDSFETETKIQNF